MRENYLVVDRNDNPVYIGLNRSKVRSHLRAPGTRVVDGPDDFFLPWWRRIINIIWRGM